MWLKYQDAISPSLSPFPFNTPHNSLRLPHLIPFFSSFFLHLHFFNLRIYYTVSRCTQSCQPREHYPALNKHQQKDCKVMDHAYTPMTEERICSNDCGYFKVLQLPSVDWAWRTAVETKHLWYVSNGKTAPCQANGFELRLTLTGDQRFYPSMATCLEAIPGSAGDNITGLHRCVIDIIFSGAGCRSDCFWRPCCCEWSFLHIPGWSFS